MNRNSILDADETRAVVRNLAGHGFSDQDIVCYAGIKDSKQLHEEFDHDLATAEIDSNLEVARSLYDMATSRKNFTATSFWLRCRAGWTVDAEETFGSGPRANLQQGSGGTRIVRLKNKTRKEPAEIERGLPTLRPTQQRVFNNDKRFRILVAGRRFGKTFLALHELIRGAEKPGSLAWYVGPSYRQAKSIAWKPLKKMTRPFWAKKPNESELQIELVTGGTICLRGADNYDSLRGNGLDFLVLDEFASISKDAWPEVLRPALADKMGRALLIGTPRGHDHFYDLFEAAQTQDHWKAFQYTTEQGGNVKPEEIACATKELDERTYRQEFQASFENLAVGRVYHAFDRKGNLETLGYNPRLPIFWSLDFNVNPMCSVIAQRDGNYLHILEELYLPDSHTQAACVEFNNRASKWGRRQNVVLFGDSSGNGRHSSASRTDWQIVREALSCYGYNVNSRVPTVNPPVKDRVNCVNAMLCNQAGDRYLTIDPKCRELIKDLEQVTWDVDAIDKSDSKRSHLSDALGYVISTDFGMKPKAGYQPGRLL